MTLSEQVSALAGLLGRDSEGTGLDGVGKVFGKAFSDDVASLRGRLALASLFRFPDILSTFSLLSPPPLVVSSTDIADGHEGCTVSGYSTTRIQMLENVLKKDRNPDLVRLSSEEKEFLLRLLGGLLPPDLGKRSPEAVLDWASTTLGVSGPDLAPLHRAALNAAPLLPARLPTSPMPLRLAPDHFSSLSSEQALETSLRQLLTAPSGLALPPAFISFPLLFARPPPPLYEADDELLWLHSTEVSEFVPLWDDGMLLEEGREEEEETTKSQGDAAEESTEDDMPKSSPDKTSSKGSPGKDSERAPLAVAEEDDADPVTLLNKALTTQLMVNQANWLCERVREDPGLVGAVGMSPEKLPSLVEANPPVAVIVLLTLIADPAAAETICTYFETLVCMEVTVHGMEVVNRLTSQVELPPDFMHIYILNCISACEAMEEHSLAQNRLVRLVCVFLQALIRNRVISVGNEVQELRTFCIHFARIKEAAALYKVVQSLAKDDQATSHTSTS